MTIIPGWIDTAGRTRTWVLVRDGQKVAEISTLASAYAICRLLAVEPVYVPTQHARRQGRYAR